MKIFRKLILEIPVELMSRDDGPDSGGQSSSTNAEKKLQQQKLRKQIDIRI